MRLLQLEHGCIAAVHKYVKPKGQEVTEHARLKDVPGRSATARSLQWHHGQVSVSHVARLGAPAAGDDGPSPGRTPANGRR